MFREVESFIRNAPQGPIPHNAKPRKVHFRSSIRYAWEHLLSLGLAQAHSLFRCSGSYRHVFRNKRPDEGEGEAPGRIWPTSGDDQTPFGDKLRAKRSTDMPRLPVAVLSTLLEKHFTSAPNSRAPADVYSCAWVTTADLTGALLPIAGGTASTRLSIFIKVHRPNKALNSNRHGLKSTVPLGKDGILGVLSARYRFGFGDGYGLTIGNFVFFLVVLNYLGKGVGFVELSIY